MSEILEDSDECVLLPVPAGQAPRSAFGHIFGAQLAASWALGLLSSPNTDEISEMLGRLRAASSRADLVGGDGMSETMARSMLDREIGIASPSELAPAGYRFTCQVNENSDGFANSSDVPEMNHNEIVAWASEGSSRALVALTCEGMHPRTHARMAWMLDNIESEVVWRIECEGESLLERLLYAAHVTDWVSIAMALAKGKDPSEMAAIDSLKAHLASIQ